MPTDRANGVRCLSTGVTKRQSIYDRAVTAKPSFTHAWDAFWRRSAGGHYVFAGHMPNAGVRLLPRLRFR